MPFNKIVVSGFSLLLTSTLCATEKNTPALNTNPITQHLMSIEKIFQQQDGIMQGSVKFVLQQSRIWHPGESFNNGDNWLALACSLTECKLSLAKLVVQQEDWQGHYDEQPTKGQRLSFSLINAHETQVVAWFKSQSESAWLRPGPVISYHSPLIDYKQPPLGGNLEVRINHHDSYADVIPMVITQQTLQKVWPEQSHYNSINLLQLREKEKRQLLLGRLGECNGFSGEAIQPENYLKWAGDLDRDGLTDYLISYIDEEGMVHLYLSGEAKADKLVGLSGTYRSPPWGGECSGG